MASGAMPDPLGAVDADEPAPDAGHADDLVDRAAATDLLAAGMAGRAHPAFEAGEVPGRIDALPVVGEVVKARRMGIATPMPLVAHPGPRPRGARLPGSRSRHLHRHVVGMDRMGVERMRATASARAVGSVAVCQARSAIVECSR